MSSKNSKLIRSYLISTAEKIGFHLAEGQAEMMEEHAAELIMWNKKINLTAIKTPEDIAEKHFVDCLPAVQLLKDSERVLDMGSGGGFPGMVLNIMNPSLSVLMVDASRKKVNFLKHVIRKLGLDQAQAVHARAEDLAEDDGYTGQFDAVISRAFSDLALFEKLAAPFLKPGGRILAMKGSRAGEEISSADLAGYDLQTISYRLPVEKSDRCIVSLCPKA